MFTYIHKNNNIIAVYCSEITNEGNAEWNETFANGTRINGKCLNGFYGSVSRKCIQSGSFGNWSMITGSCNGILTFSFPFSFLFSFSFFFFFFFLFEDEFHLQIINK